MFTASLPRMTKPHSLGRGPIDPASSQFLGTWTHRPGVIAVSHSSTAHTPGRAFLEDAATGERTLLTAGDQPVVLDLDRDNRWVLVRRGPRGARSVWSIDRKTGQERQLVPRGGTGSTDLARLSPDARLAYLRSNAGGEMFGLFAVDLHEADVTRATQLVAERAEAEVEDILLTADGTRALLMWNFAGRSECQLLTLATGERRDIELPEPVAHEGSFSGDGRWLTLTLEGPTEPRAIWLLDLERSVWRRVTGSAGLIANGVHPTLEFVRADDGLQITGWLYRAQPTHARPGPTVIHLFTYTVDLKHKSGRAGTHCFKRSRAAASACSRRMFAARRDSVAAS